MPLRKQKIEIPLVRGLDKKSSDKFVQPGGLTKAENIVFGEHGSLRKRHGHTAVTTNTTGGGTVSSGTALYASGDKVLLFDDERGYAWADGPDQWHDIGGAIKQSVVYGPARVHYNSISAWDRAEANGIAVYAYHDATDALVYADAIDVQTGAVLLSRDSVDSLGSTEYVGIQCVAIGQYIHILVCRSNTSPTVSVIRAYSYDTLSPTTVVAGGSNIKSDADFGVATVAAAPYSATKAVVVYRDTSNNYQAFFLNDDRTAEANVQISQIGTGLSRVTVFKDGGTGVYIAKETTVAHRDSALAADWDTDVDPDALTGSSPEIAGGLLSTGGTKWLIRDVNAVGASDRIWYSELNSSGVVQGSPRATQVHSGELPLVSTAFVYSDTLYCVAMVESTLQPTYYVVNEDGQVVASFAVGKAARVPFDNQHRVWPNVQEISTGLFRFGIGVIQRDTDGQNKVTIGQGELDFTTGAIQGVEFDKNVYVSGGLLAVYDGEIVSEAGFLAYPEYSTHTQNSSGSIADGTYLYRAIFEYEDANGKIYRSAPSPAQTVTVTGGSGTASVDFETTQHHPTNRGRVTVALYRTEAGLETNYYRVGETSETAFTNETVTVTDTVADAALVANQLLYTVGGELENIFPPACTSLSLFTNRLWIAGLPNPREIWFSKELLSTEGPGFSDSLVVYAPEDVVAIAKLDQRLLIFSENAIFFVFGEGPTATGAGSSYGQPEYITAEVGAVSAASVKECPAGVVFESKKGLYLLNRALQLQYIGRELETIIDGESPTFTSVETLPDRNEVRFITSDNDCFTWNYEFNQWSELTGMAAVDAAVWGDTYAYLKSDGTVEKENANYDDDASFVAMELETGWISLAGVQGYKRLYEIQLMSEFVAAHDLDVYIAYDYDDTEVEQFTLSAVAAGDIPMSFRPARQKCSAFRLRIVDSFSSVNGGSLVLESLMLRIGVKGTPARLAAAQRTAGTSI